MLSGLAQRSKAHWPYSAEQIEEFMPDLCLTAKYFETSHVHVSEQYGQVVGFFALCLSGGSWLLDHFWVEPRHIGQGIGRELMQRALEVAGSLAAAEVLIYSEPYAEGFYLGLGAEPLGFMAAPIIGDPLRKLPLLALTVPEALRAPPDVF